MQRDGVPLIDLTTTGTCRSWLLRCLPLGHPICPSKREHCGARASLSQTADPGVTFQAHGSMAPRARMLSGLLPMPSSSSRRFFRCCLTGREACRSQPFGCFIEFSAMMQSFSTEQSTPPLVLSHAPQHPANRSMQDARLLIACTSLPVKPQLAPPCTRFPEARTQLSVPCCLRSVAHCHSSVSGYRIYTLCCGVV